MKAKLAHIFTWSMCFLGVYLRHFNLFFLFINLFGFILLDKKFHVWNFTNKFPTTPFHLLKIPRTFFCDSPFIFYKEIKDLWVHLGRNHFRTWIGFERFLVLSKFEDIEVSNNRKLRVTKLGE